ncbi:MAG: hypothetical protein H6R09_954 [Proteobacteria bacterium]|nr:hypothetical protein [Pseudomonadota bacterium]
MPADQAAGLRRCNSQQPLRCIHGFFDSAEATSRLAVALHRCGWTTLVVDTCGRVFADSPTRSLFDWRQQIARGQPHRLRMTYGDGWHAPGMRVDEPGLMAIAQGYDCLLFDLDLNAPDWGTVPGAAPFFVIEVNAKRESMLDAYALLKTLSHRGSRVSVGLLGNPAACDRLQQACKTFLDPTFNQAVFSFAREIDAFAALAVRMTGEETSLTARYITESTANMALKHGW